MMNSPIEAVRNRLQSCPERKTSFPMLYTKWIMMSVLSQPLIILTERKTFLPMLYTKWVMVITKTW